VTPSEELEDRIREDWKASIPKELKPKRFWRDTRGCFLLDPENEEIKEEGQIVHDPDPLNTPVPLPGRKPRRHFTEEEKRAIVAEANAPGACVAEICRKRGIAAASVHDWRKRAAPKDKTPTSTIKADAKAAVSVLGLLRTIHSEVVGVKARLDSLERAITGTGP